MVADGRQCVPRRAIATSTCVSPLVCRRFVTGMGSAYGCQSNIRSVVASTQEAPHKSVGTRGSHVSSAPLDTSVEESVTLSSHRQCSGSLGDQSSGLNASKRSVVADNSIVRSSGRTEFGYSGCPHSGSKKCLSRRPITTRQPSVYGVATKSTDVSGVVPAVREATCGPVCHQAKQTTTHLCFASPRSRGLGLRRARVRLGRDGRLCFSSSRSSNKSSGETSGDAVYSSAVGSPLVAGASVVRSTAPPVLREPSSNPSSSRSTDQQAKWSGSRESTGIQPSRLACIKRGLRRGDTRKQ